MSRNDVQNAAGDATQTAHPGGSRDPADAAMLEADRRNQGTTSGQDPRAGANTAIDNLRGTASANVPDETKDRARDSKNRTADYMKNKLPKERREQTIFRLKKMIVEIQSHSDCEFWVYSDRECMVLTQSQTNKPLRPCCLSLKNMEDTARVFRSKVPEQSKVLTAILH